MSYKLLNSSKVNQLEEILVKRYLLKSGIVVVIADIFSPIVSGFFVLATEEQTNDGLPHTLEHLIFLGSEQYPFKGILDLLANRNLAAGTNAWTDTDHTCYTISTAGSEGFLSLLPIYVDHILFPTLKESGFITEVHHIAGDGTDAGVVYCEMQGRENSAESLTNLALLRNIYPNSGYSAETGGIMENLRVSTTIEKIKKYHSKYYCPENLTLIIAGKIDIDAVVAALQPIEEKILANNKSLPFLKPWQSDVEPLTCSKSIKVLFPSDEEDCGLFCIGWLGPKSTTEYETLTACSILLKYLSETSVSPLQQKFIEIEDPYASRIVFNITENSQSLLFFTFENVPLEKIEQIFDKLMFILKSLSDGRIEFDMSRMRTICDKYVLERLSSFEHSPQEDIAFHLIGDVLYGETDKDLEDRLNVISIIKKFESLKKDFWINLLNKYFVENFSVTVRSFPSIEAKVQIAKEEADRLLEQRTMLNEVGLAKKAKMLEDAMKENDIQPTKELLTSVPVPSTNSIKFHSVSIFKKSDKINSTHIVDFSKLPFYCELYDLRSSFIYMIACLDTTTLPVEMRSYLLLFLDLIKESPIRKNGELIAYENVVAELERDTICYDTSLGVESSNRFSSGPFSNFISLSLQVEQKKFEVGIDWLTNLLFKTEFSVERIKVCANKMANEISQAKRNGVDIARGLLQLTYYNKDSNVAKCSMMQQYKFLLNLITELDECPVKCQKIVDDFNKLRKILTESKNISLHLAADWSKLNQHNATELLSKWIESRSITQECENEFNPLSDHQLIKQEGYLEDFYTGTIVGIGCVESAFLFQACPGIKSFMDPDLPAIMLSLQYLTQCEGALWRNIRGPGYSYGYSIVPRVNENLIYFSLYRASNLVAAFRETKKIVETQLQDDAEWDSVLLESARSSLIFEIIEREKTIGDVVLQSLLSSFKKTPKDYNKILVDNISKVTIEDLQRVGKLYLIKLFGDQAKVSIVCNPNKVQQIKTAFVEFGHKLKASDNLEDSLMNCHLH